MVRRTGKRWGEVAEQLYDIKKQLAELSKMSKLLSKELQELSQYDSAYNGVFEYSKTVRIGAISAALILEDYDIDGEKYRRPEVEMWKLQKR